MNIQQKAAQIVADAKQVTWASIDENGYPRPVMMDKLKSDDGIIYASTGTNTAKASHYRQNPKAGVSIIDGPNSVVYTGEAEIVADVSLKHRLWEDWMAKYFAQGADDPEYCILKFTPKHATYWIDQEFVREDLI